MKDPKNWIFIDNQTKSALYGAGNKTFSFSTKEIAQEVAEQLFEKTDRYIIVNIVTDLRLEL